MFKDKWMKFKFGSLIDYIDKGKAYRKSDLLNGALSEGSLLNYITRTDFNNGCESKIKDLKFIGEEKGNAIIIGDTTSTIFYQKDPFICGDHIVVIRAKWLNEKRGQFICTLLQKERYKYSYGRAFTIDYIKNVNLYLPVDNFNNPDWKKIDAFIYKFKKTIQKNVDKIVEVSKGDKSIISILNSKVNPFDFEKWTNSEKNCNISLSTDTWKEFYVSRNNNHKGLFDISNCKCKNATILEDGNDVFYRGAKKTNNGVMKSVSEDSEIMSKGNCIFFICDGDGSCGYTNYVYDDFIGSTTTATGYDDNLNAFVGLFIVTILDMEKFKYSHGRKYRINLEKTKILLPAKMINQKYVTDLNSKYSDQGFIPDFEFMEKYIRSLPYSNKIQERSSCN